MARRLAAIMFTDIAGFTPLSQSDEPGALRLLQEQEKLVRPTLELHHGRKVKSTGDGLLIEFPNALDAVECAVELQRRLHEHNSEDGARPLVVRIGIHLGDVQRQGTDILGDAVNIASRVEPLAEPGGVSLSEPVYVQVRNKVPYQLEELGPKTLKGVREPVDVFRVVLPWNVPGMPTGRSIPPRLAVLPLVNFSPDPEDGFFADGLTEEIISTVSKIPQLAVISRTSVMRYKNPSKSLTDIGRELNAGILLEGSVRKAGNRVRVAVQLLDAEHDRHLWSESYDRGLEDVFGIQSEIAQKVAGELEIHLLKEDKERIGSAPTRVTEAYLLYLKGRARLQYFAKEELLRAAECFEQAIRKDPRYALAYAGLARCYGLLATNEMLPSEEAVPKTAEAAKKALELDASLAEAHLALYHVSFLSCDLGSALKEIQRASDLDPNLAEAHAAAAWVYACRRQFQDARVEAEKAIKLDPVSGETLGITGTVYLYSGSPERAAELFERITTLDPANSFAMNNLGLCHVQLGKFEEGIREIKKGMEMSGEADPGKQVDLAYAYARAGRIDAARRTLAELVRFHEEHGRGAVFVADAYASVGDQEKALEWLETAYRERSPNLVSSCFVDFYLPALTSDPRYRSLLQRVMPA